GLFRGPGLVLDLGVVRHRVEVAFEGVETVGPEPPIGREPLVDVGQRAGSQSVPAALGLLSHRHQTGLPQDAQVLGHRGLGECQFVHQLPHQAFPGSEQVEALPPTRFGQRRERSCHVGYITRAEWSGQAIRQGTGCQRTNAHGRANRGACPQRWKLVSPARDSRWTPPSSPRSWNRRRSACPPATPSPRTTSPPSSRTCSPTSVSTCRRPATTKPTRGRPRWPPRRSSPTPHSPSARRPAGSAWTTVACGTGSSSTASPGGRTTAAGACPRGSSRPTPRSPGSTSCCAPYPTTSPPWWSRAS